MEGGILFELQFFGRAFLWGIALRAAYDVLELLRRVLPHGKAAVTLEDILYWAGCAVLIFCMLYEENNGTIRGFALAAVILGMLLCLQFEKLCGKVRKKLRNSVKRFIIKLRST